MFESGGGWGVGGGVGVGVGRISKDQHMQIGINQARPLLTQSMEI